MASSTEEKPVPPPVDDEIIDTATSTDSLVLAPETDEGVLEEILPIADIHDSAESDNLDSLSDLVHGDEENTANPIQADAEPEDESPEEESPEEESPEEESVTEPADDAVDQEDNEPVVDLLTAIINGDTEDEEDVVGDVPTSFRELSSAKPPAPFSEPEIEIDRGNVFGVKPPNSQEMQKILDTLQESLTDTRYISAKISGIDSETERLTTLISGISVNYELMAAELEVISASSTGKKALSKMFLGGSLLLLSTLVIFQVYMFVSLITIQRDQNTTGSAVMTNITSLSKKLAEYDKNLTKSLAQAPHHEESPPIAQPVTGEKSGEQPPHGTPIVAPHGATAAPAIAATPTAMAQAVPLAEKLNRVRNGVPEKLLFRKETGDWFIYSKKSEECITDVEIIEALNAAYHKIGRSITTKVPLPAHKAICLLKSDSKGGTVIVMTKEFLP